VHCELNGNICKFLNKSFQMSLFLLPVTILTALFYILKMLVLTVRVSPSI
jgi:hypothetical protein